MSRSIHARTPYYATCLRCNSKLEKNSYRKMKRTKRSFEADRGTVAVLNIKRKALIKMKSSNSPIPR
ncbi:MAG: hypothetical protein LM582_03560 [Desulfurococcaceae archaeon]|nr:hypothetical protein [Desulfurococcaceae archaeon]